MTGGPRKAGCRWILSQVLSMVIMDVDNHDVIWFEVLFPWKKKSSEMAWSSCWNHRILALLLHLSSSHRRSIWSEHAGIGFMIYVFHEILESCEWLASQFACTQFMDFRILGLSWMTNRRSLTSYPRGFCGEMWCVWRSFDAFDV